MDFFASSLIRTKSRNNNKNEKHEVIRSIEFNTNTLYELKLSFKYLQYKSDLILRKYEL